MLNTKKIARIETPGGPGNGIEEIKGVCGIMNNIRKESIHFQFRQRVLEKDNSYLLAVIAGIIRKNPDIKADIAGHTCDIGKESYNMSLSKARAENILKYFIEKENIPVEKFDVYNYGEKMPVASNATPAGRARNRRVEIIIKP